MPISDQEYHERQENKRAYYRNEIEAAHALVTREQTAELRELRHVIELFLERLPDVPQLLHPSEEETR